MNLAGIVRALNSELKLVPARNAEQVVPRRPGLYSIFIDDPRNLPPPFGEVLRTKGTQMIYLGKASTNLQSRPVAQDLRHKRPSTFFRSIGAVLGYKPLTGSLKGKKNQSNYRFTPQDTLSISEWINRHLSVRWVTLTQAEVEEWEGPAISAVKPLLNISNNPDALPALIRLRDQCRSIARGTNPRASPAHSSG